MNFIRLTDLDNNLQLINADNIDAVYLSHYKGQVITKVGLHCGVYVAVKETVSQISLLLQDAGLVIK